MDRNERLKRARECALYVYYNYYGVNATGIVHGYSNMPNCEKIMRIGCMGFIVEDVNIENITKAEYKRPMITLLSEPIRPLRID